MKKTKIIRMLEIIPGLTIWIAFILPVIFSFFAPAVVATYVIIFDLYWLYKSIVMGFHLVSGYKLMKHDIKVDWLEKCRNLESDPVNLNFTQIFNAVIFAVSKESFETVVSSVEALANSDYPLKKIILVVATEKRYSENGQKIISLIKKKFDNRFFEIIATEHPDIIGEVKAKGANVRWAAKHLQKFIEEKNIAFENVIVTTADSDTRFHPKYLASLTYKYITNPNRDHRSFQPIPLYSNNIWHAPAISRVIAFGNSFWQLIEVTRPWRLMNFSTHAMSLKMLVEIDFWDVSVVNEDSRQFWRAYFKFDGDHEVVPVFVPVYMDAVLADSWILTMKNQYLQKKRWYYGVEHFPYVVTNSISNKKIPLWDKLVKNYRLFEANYSLATSSIYIAVIAWLPLVIGPHFTETVLGQNLQGIVRVLLMLTWVGLVVSMIISTLLLPPRPKGMGKRRSFEMLAQWVLTPITAIFFSSIPAIDAQTRFMFGKYMTFWVTEKKAVKNA